METNDAQNTPLTTEVKTSGDSKSRETCTTRWKFLAVSLILFNLLCLLVLLILATVWRMQYGKPGEINMNQLYCIDCSKVNDTREYETSDDSGGKQCCGSADMIVEDLVAKKIKQNYKEEEMRDPFSYSHMHCEAQNDQKRPATRVVGLLHRTESNSNELQWGKNEKLTFRHMKIEYKDGKLKPLDPGTYYLYSQVTVNLNRTSTSPISHTVYKRRSRDQKMEQLLEGSISNCQLSVNSSDSTSYLGAAFMLAAGDQIAVKITHPAMVKYDSDAGNYFGMHKI